MIYVYLFYIHVMHACKRFIFKFLLKIIQNTLSIERPLTILKYPAREFNKVSSKSTWKIREN